MAMNGIGGYGGVSGYSQTAWRGAASGIPGVTAPEFGPDKMYTKTKQTRSDEEIMKDIIQLAKKDAARGVNGFGGNSGRESKEYQKLVHEYITPYSPDRKSIFAKRMGEISTGLKQKPYTGDYIDTSLMELMLTGEVKDKGKAGRALERLINQSNGDLGGNTITGKVSMIQFREGGTPVGSWSSTYGWGYQPTDTEVARRVDAANLYLETWKNETGIK